MANPIIDVHCGVPDPSVQPQTFVQACAAIDLLLTGAFSGPNSYIPYIVGPTTPSVDNQDKVWIQTAPGGQPLAIKLYFNGNWRRVYTGKIGQVTMFMGDPTAFFDGTGLGMIGLDWEGWAICNGLNSTPDLSDLFPIGAHMNNTGGVSGFSVSQWQTGVEGSPRSRGGSAFHQLFLNHIPRPPRPASTDYRWNADGQAPGATGSLHGEFNASAGTTVEDAGDPGLAEPGAPFNVTNPYFATCLVQFVGYPDA